MTKTIEEFKEKYLEYKKLLNQAEALSIFHQTIFYELEEELSKYLKNNYNDLPEYLHSNVIIREVNRLNLI